jgi:hypothetical protein
VSISVLAITDSKHFLVGKRSKKKDIFLVFSIHSHTAANSSCSDEKFLLMGSWAAFPNSNYTQKL